METQLKTSALPYESRDKICLTELMQQVFTFVEAKYKELYPLEKPPFLSQTYRSGKAQDELYKLGRTKKGGIVTHARSGESPHNYYPSFAFDLAFIDKKNPKGLDWAVINFKRVNDIIQNSEYSTLVTWGGSWPKPKTDRPHFEQKDWKTHRH